MCCLLFVACCVLFAFVCCDLIIDYRVLSCHCCFGETCRLLFVVFVVCCLVIVAGCWLFVDCCLLVAVCCFVCVCCCHDLFAVV